RIKTGGFEFNVIRLPRQGRITHVHRGLELRVDAAALVVLALEAEAVKYLNLPPVLEIDATVAPPLAAGVGHERQAEVQVQPAVLKGLFTLHAHLEEVPFDQFAAGPLVDAGAVEQYDRPRQRLGTQSGALAHHVLERERLAVGDLAGELAVGDFAAEVWP